MEWIKVNDDENEEEEEEEEEEDEVVDLSLKLGLPDHPPAPAPAPAADPPPTPQQQQLLKCFSYTPLGIQMDMEECSKTVRRQQGGPSYFICPTNQQQVASAGSYTLIDVPARRSVQGSSSSVLSGGRSCRLGIGQGGDNGSGSGLGSGSGSGSRGSSDDKRCTNINCNTVFTPMWRKGPLGPKTLCNACGIKYRKDEEKRRAKEAQQTDTDPNPDA